MTQTIREQLERFMVEEPVGDGTYRKVSLMEYADRYAAEAVAARLARDAYRRSEMLAPNATAYWYHYRANDKTETIRAFGRVLEEIRGRRFQHEADALAAERHCQLTYGGEYCGEIATAWDGALDRDLCDEHRGAADPANLSELELRYAHGDR